MKVDVAAARKCLKSFDFNTLFREHLGWDNHKAQLEIPVDGDTVTLTAIAQKRGFVAFVCSSIPDRPTRLKIDHQVTKSAREHFVIYSDEAAGQQVWQWVRRETGKPIASRDHRFSVSQTGDPLIQRLDQIAVSIDEEEGLTLPDIAGRIRSALDVDKVTKKFYDRFKTEHTAFLKHIKGFPPARKVKGKLEYHPDLQWYTSLMLNRVMFVYFIQKKGFLDGDTDYLRNRLAMVREARGKDKFQTFYRYFLLRLFHEGLGKHKDERKLDPAMEKLLGKVPYLNGGFFEVHQLEEHNPDIDIPDKAFEKLFDFFDNYRWHLDERPLRADNEINPDVVGYIFEKYINQKQMGAYYTKEDITEYISKNTILPYLFDTARKKCAVAFKADSAIWQLLRDDPDRYIYPAVRHGVIDEKGEVIPLPKDIAAGIKDVSKRGGWNRSAEDPYALPTETWREHVARRQRCLDIRKKLSKGEVHEINDLITLNLDIWQFARDAIVNAEGPELLRAFWHTLAGKSPEKSNDRMEPGITILDPTCGSGAFLFAALRILETLYGDCLERMQRFIEDVEHAAPSTPEDEVRALIAAGESATVEFKASARWDLKENRHNPVLEEVIVKTVVGFLNAHGGTLLIGVTDNGVPIGLDRDYQHTKKKNPCRDQFELWLTNHLMKKLGREAKPCFHIDFAECDGEDVCRVRVYRSPKPAFVEKSGQEVLYVRQGNATNPYTKSSEIIAYKEQHWPAGQPAPKPPPPPSVDAAASAKTAAKAKRAYSDFRKTLAQIEEHRGERYFILKSIIINNLFGVDIMEEAVEICKLRLFLKLVAQVDTFDQIEPLPDIDFNIRAGNTLVGFASLDQVKKSMEGDMLKLLELPRIEESAEEVDRLYQQFRAQQTTHGGKVTAEDKQELRKRLGKLDAELDRYLASEYGVDVEKQKDFDAWKATHEPFHWFVEFYGIMHGGGFDVIIGNPPYVNTRKIPYSVTPMLYDAETAGDLFALTIEQGLRLVRESGHVGLIVPLSATSTATMQPVRRLLAANTDALWASYYSASDQPSSLFTGVRHRLCILLGRRSSAPSCSLFTTRFMKWFSDERAALFQSFIEYAPAPSAGRAAFPKVSQEEELSLLERLCSFDTLGSVITKRGKHVYYHNAPVHWGKVFDFIPKYRIDNGPCIRSSHLKDICFSTHEEAAFAICLLNSSLFYWFNWQFSNCRDLSSKDIQRAPAKLKGTSPATMASYVGLCKKLMDDYRNHRKTYTRVSDGATAKFDSFYPMHSKAMLDRIDTVLAKHFGMSDDELEHIINYDLKYRFGKSFGNSD